MNRIAQVGDMAQLINTLGVATVALSIIFVIFLTLISYVIYQNKQLTNNLITSSKESISELRLAILDLTKNIEKMAKTYELAIEDIAEEISKLREKYIEVTAQLSVLVYDERVLSDNAFYEIAKKIIDICIYKSLIDAYTEIDQNGFESQDRILLLKDNIIRIFDRRRNEGKAEILALNYNKDKIDNFCNLGEEIYLNNKEKIQDDILQNIDKIKLCNDKNYKNLKNLISNILFRYRDEVITLLKEVSRRNF